jgi:hypothetical protein
LRQRTLDGLDQARAALGDERFTLATSRGRLMALEQAVARGLAGSSSG